MGKVIARSGGQLIANSLLSRSVVGGFGFPASNSEKRIVALLGPQGERPDVVLVHMDINDCGWGGAATR